MLPSDFNLWLTDKARRPLVMGVLNVTPDSFSDGGRFAGVDEAVTRAEQMVAEGAELIDIGGESTRPGAERVSADEQIRRVVPVLEACRGLPITFSIDTTRAAVAEAALNAGATIVNDVSAGRDDPAIVSLVARHACPVVLMHMLGQPATMQLNPHYADVVADVRAFLAQRASDFEAAGVKRDNILVDPGIGFGKTAAHNWQLMAGTGQIVADGRPVLMGVSRKKFIGTLTGRDTPADRVFGTAAAVTQSVLAGAAIVRVHDVAAMVDVVKVAQTLRDYGLALSGR
jgi:dihydropteroate synthase